MEYKNKTFSCFCLHSLRAYNWEFNSTREMNAYLKLTLTEVPIIEEFEEFIAKKSLD